MTYIYLLIAILAIIWRVVDGSSKKPKNWQLLPILPILIVALCGLYMHALALIIAYASLLDGFRGWHNWGAMRMRYTGYASLACAFASVSLWYVPMALIAGLSYPTMHLLYSKGFRLPHVGIVNNYTTYCEAICSATMFVGACWIV